MKSATINTIVKIIFFTAVFALFTIGTVLTASANDGNNPVAIKYMGAFSNQPVFQVAFDNQNNETLFVTLKDNEGNVLYSEKFAGKKFSKLFQLSRNDEDMQVVLTLSGRKSSNTQEFQINRNLRMIEDVTVTRVR